MKRRILFQLALPVFAVLMAAFVVIQLGSNAVFVPAPVSTPDRPRPTPESVSDDNLPSPPDSDPYTLAQRLRLQSLEPVQRDLPLPTRPYEVGRLDQFWVTNVGSGQRFQVTARIGYVTPHLYVYIQDGIDVPSTDVQRSADDFETRVYPCVHQYFGQELSASPGHDPHLTVLATRGTGAGGYYSSSDEYPLQVNPFSNQREMFYLDTGAIRFGTPMFAGVMAHEFQHTVRWNLDHDEQAWVNEGLSELSADLCGNGPSFVQAFVGNSNTQLTSWAALSSATGPNYGAAYAFFKYLSVRFGPDQILDLGRGPKHGVDGVQTWLSHHGFPDFNSVFKDWVVANFLNDSSSGRFGYGGAKIQVAPTGTLANYGKIDGRVRQYAAQYYDITLPAGDAVVNFQGDVTNRMISNEPHASNREWWSNRADGMDSTLTRELDLLAVDTATLHFWTWYDLEKGWDFAYLEASTDGGKTWNILRGKYSSDFNPAGNGYGVGWTGESGGSGQPTWAEEEVDLTPFAGKKVMVRFECVTDEAVNLEGFALDNISIPEIGFSDDTETANGWTADGFARITDVIPQPFQVQIIRFGPAAVVDDLPLDTANKGSYKLQGFGKELSRAVVVVSAVAPVTTRDAGFSISVDAAK